MNSAEIVGPYRYRLTRGTDPHRLVFVMLNPSTADATEDDATIRRLIGFSREWGYSGFTVVNLYAYRSRDPKKLKWVSDPIGPMNHSFISKAVKEAEMVIAAWGNNPPNPGVGERFISQHGSAKLRHLGLTLAGHPRHPLYLPASTKPQRFE